MKLHLDQPGAINFITACEPAYVQVNQARYTASLIVLTHRVIEAWRPDRFAALAEQDFDELAGLGADIVLLGTGRTLRFPHPRLTRALMERRIGLEVMDAGAACRTYNILAGEGRKVAAALIFDPA